MVIASMGQGDEEALQAALAGGAGYVGLVASSKRGSAVLAELRARGLDEEALARVRCPAGLDLGPSSQEEIAVAILAELVAWRHTKPSSPAQLVEPAVAIDPVCGMTVAIEGAPRPPCTTGSRTTSAAPGAGAGSKQDAERYLGGRLDEGNLGDARPLEGLGHEGRDRDGRLDRALGAARPRARCSPSRRAATSQARSRAAASSPRCSRRRARCSRAAGRACAPTGSPTRRPSRSACPAAARSTSSSTPSTRPRSIRSRRRSRRSGPSRGSFPSRARTRAPSGSSSRTTR